MNVLCALYGCDNMVEVPSGESYQVVCEECQNKLHNATVYNQPDINKVDHPDHYGGKDNPYEVIKVAEAQLTPEEFIGAMKFNVMKYNARHAKKHGLRDVKSAQWYQNRLVAYLEKQEALNSVELSPP